LLIEGILSAGESHQRVGPGLFSLGILEGVLRGLLGEASNEGNEPVGKVVF
jgi:hypothetical protein